MKNNTRVLVLTLLKKDMSDSNSPLYNKAYAKTLLGEDAAAPAEPAVSAKAKPKPKPKAKTKNQKPKAKGKKRKSEEMDEEAQQAEQEEDVQVVEDDEEDADEAYRNEGDDDALWDPLDDE